MIYRVFLSESTEVKLAELNVNWPVIKIGELLPIEINGKEILYKVTETSGFRLDGNRIIQDIWVKPDFPGGFSGW